MDFNAKLSTVSALLSVSSRREFLKDFKELNRERSPIFRSFNNDFLLNKENNEIMEDIIKTHFKTSINKAKINISGDYDEDGNEMEMIIKYDIIRMSDTEKAINIYIDRDDIAKCNFLLIGDDYEHRKSIYGLFCVSDFLLSSLMSKHPEILSHKLKIYNFIIKSQPARNRYNIFNNEIYKLIRLNDDIFDLRKTEDKVEKMEEIIKEYSICDILEEYEINEKIKILCAFEEYAENKNHDYSEYIEEDKIEIYKKILFRIIEDDQKAREYNIFNLLNNVNYNNETRINFIHLNQDFNNPNSEEYDEYRISDKIKNTNNFLNYIIEQTQPPAVRSDNIKYFYKFYDFIADYLGAKMSPHMLYILKPAYYNNYIYSDIFDEIKKNKSLMRFYKFINNNIYNKAYYNCYNLDIRQTGAHRRQYIKKEFKKFNRNLNNIIKDDEAYININGVKIDILKIIYSNIYDILINHL